MSRANEETRIEVLPAPAVSKPVVTQLHKAEIYDEFVRFMAMPDPDKAELFQIPRDTKGKYERIPTQKDFARKYGVHENTLGNWKSRPDFGQSVLSKRVAWGADRTPNVLAALYRRCVQYGRGEDVETWLKIMEDWDPKKGNPLTVNNHFSVNDIRVIVAALPPDKQQQYHELIGNLIIDAQRAGIGAD